MCRVGSCGFPCAKMCDRELRVRVTRSDGGAQDENNVEAMLNLALLQLNVAKKDNIAQALMLLKKAYELMPQHPRCAP